MVLLFILTVFHKYCWSLWSELCSLVFIANFCPVLYIFETPIPWPLCFVYYNFYSPFSYVQMYKLMCYNLPLSNCIVMIYFEILPLPCFYLIFVFDLLPRTTFGKFYGHFPLSNILCILFQCINLCVIIFPYPTVLFWFILKFSLYHVFI